MGGTNITGIGNQFNDGDNEVESHKSIEPLWIDRELLKANHKIASLIYIALMLSVVVYILIGEFLASQNSTFAGFVSDPSLDDIEEKFRLICFAVSIASFLLISIVNKMILSFKADTVNVNLATKVCMKQLITATLVRGAYAEVVAVIGLVLFLTYGVKTDLYYLSGLSFLYFVIFFPKYKKWEAWVEKVERSYIGFAN